jgi:hypothetical protein
MCLREAGAIWNISPGCFYCAGLVLLKTVERNIATNHCLVWQGIFFTMLGIVAIFFGPVVTKTVIFVQVKVRMYS